LDSQIGQQLIEHNQEESVQCSQTEQVRSQIKERKARVTHLAEQEATARELLTTKADELATALNLPKVDGTSTLSEESKKWKAMLTEAEQAQAKLERELPAVLLADPSIPADTELGSRLIELHDMEQRLGNTSSSSIGPAIEWFSQLSTTAKALIGGGIAMGVLVVMCCGGLALRGPDDEQSTMSAPERVAFARKCIQVAESNAELAVDMLHDKVTGVSADWNDEEVADVMLSLSDQEKTAFNDLLATCRERHDAHMQRSQAGWDAAYEDIQREEERQHELERIRASQPASGRGGWSNTSSGKADPWSDERAALDSKQGHWNGQSSANADSWSDERRTLDTASPPTKQGWDKVNAVHRLRIGMSSQQVIQIMGEPDWQLFSPTDGRIVVMRYGEDGTSDTLWVAFDQDEKNGLQTVMSGPFGRATTVLSK
jgi:hypothetical protein